MNAALIFNLIIVFVLLGFFLNRLLSWMNVRNWNPKVPDEMKEYYDAEKYRKARDYALANSKFALVSSGFSTLVLLAFLFFDGFALVNSVFLLYTCLWLGQFEHAFFNLRQLCH